MQDTLSRGPVARKTTAKKSDSCADDRERRTSDRRLIEEWLPIAALCEESIRERRSMTALPPTYYLHVWWATRPLECRATPRNQSEAALVNPPGCSGGHRPTRE
jgi:hypothetical protein